MATRNFISARSAVLRFGTVLIALLICQGHVAVFAASGNEVYSTRGHVWRTWQARVHEGKLGDYLEFLGTVYRHQLDAWVHAGLLTDYRIMTSNPQSADDWNLAIMLQYENMAALDVPSDVWDSIGAEVMTQFEDNQEIQEMLDNFESWRDFVGWSKVSREVVWLDVSTDGHDQ